MRESRDAFVVKAPTRVDLAGGTLDLWPLYCLVGGGKTINVALDLYAQCTFRASPHAAFQIEVKTLSEKYVFSQAVEAEALAKVPRGLHFPVRVINDFIRDKKNLPKLSIQIEIQSGVPVGSGLGGSSSLCVALAKGMSRIFGNFTGPEWRWEMLSWVRDVEASFLNLPTGVQDYLAALFGGLSCFHFTLGAQKREAYSPLLLTELSRRLVVVFSGEIHHSGKSNWEIFKGAMEGDQKIKKGLVAIQRITNELDAVLRASSIEWSQMGRLMSEEWQIRRDLFEVNTPRLDSLVNFFSGKGILGTKVCGAAQGGSLALLVEPSEREKVIHSCREQKAEVLKTSPVTNGVSIQPI